ncbi:ATP-binding protein [Brevibacillus sp. SYSU BS000544]|uniref:ATP-binding protein n=1 Tax=Brevibacillus sp. SYSU BS000544 TaxID=3416443 RepID=UPI003CE4C14E
MVEINSMSRQKIGYAVMAQYTEQPLLEYRDNPLIEALPPIFSLEEVMDQLCFYPDYDSRERQLEAHYRFHCIQRLFRYFQPLPQHLELERRFSILLRQGYMSRNPHQREYAIQLQDIYECIKKSDISQYKNDFRTTASGFTMIGISGIGKTTAIERILSLYPQVIVHESPLNIHQITWLKLDCPFDGSLKGLCIDFFIKVDSLLGTNYHKKFGSKSSSIDSMLPRMAQVANLHSIGALIIDEIQHLSLAKGGGSDKMLNFFVTLVNTIGIPVILVGTMKAVSILQSEFRQARRGSGRGDMVWNMMMNDEEWEVLIEGMWEYQWTKKEIPLTQEIKDVLHEESQGIIDIAVKLYMLAQMSAISTGKEMVNATLIRQVGKESLKLVRPMLDALKSGDPKKIAAYEDIRPIDIEEYKDKYLSQLPSQEKIRIQRKSEANKRHASEGNLLELVVLELIKLDIDPVVAKNAADQVLSKLGDGVTKAEALKEAMRIILSVEQNPVVEAKKKQRQKRKMNSLEMEPDDLRLIVSNGKINKQSGYEALKEKGFIQSPIHKFKF